MFYLRLNTMYLETIFVMKAMKADRTKEEQYIARQSGRMLDNSFICGMFILLRWLRRTVFLHIFRRLRGKGSLGVSAMASVV